MARAVHLGEARDVRDTQFWRGATLAGLIGGAAFLVAEMAMVMLIGQSPWTPPSMVAAILLGPEVLPAQGAAASFDLGVFMAAAAVHFPLSILYAAMLGAIIRQAKLPTLASTLTAGAVFGLVIYLVNFYLIASFAFEWFAEARNWVSFLTHMLFGIVTAWAFVNFSGPPRRLIAPSPPGGTTPG